MTKPIVDISYWQGLPYTESPADSGIDYDLLASKVDGVILRASTGSYKDLRFEQNYQELKARGVPLACYHFFKPVVTTAAQIFVFDQARGDKVFDLPHFHYALDVEAPASGWSQNKYRAEVQLMIDACGFDCVYTRASFWDPVIGYWWPGNTPDLWIAHYGVEDPAEPVAAPPYTLHQFSEKGPGAEFGVVSASIDLNKLNPETQPPPPEPPDPEPCEYPQTGKVNAGGMLNLRSYPALDSKYKIRTMQNGTALTIYDELPFQNGYEWTIVRDALGYVGVCASKYVTVDSNI